MSLLLDALKKADRERSGQQGEQLKGSLAPLAASSAPQVEPSWLTWRTFWLLILLINVAAVVWLTWHPISSIPTKEGAVSTDSVAIVAEPPVGTSHVNQTVENQLHTQEPLSRLSSANVTFDLPSAAVAKKPLALVQLAPTRVESLSETPRSVTLAELPEPQTDTVTNGSSEFQLAPRAASQGIKMGALIYSDAPTRRMIILNGKTFRAGAVLPNKWRLEAIERDALVVSRQGQSYVLPVDQIQ